MFQIFLWISTPSGGHPSILTAEPDPLNLSGGLTLNWRGTHRKKSFDGIAQQALLRITAEEIAVSNAGWAIAANYDHLKRNHENRTATDRWLSVAALCSVDPVLRFRWVPFHRKLMNNNIVAITPTPGNRRFLYDQPNLVLAIDG